MSWWQNEDGEWFRGTTHGQTIDRILDRYAEDYVRGSIKTVEELEVAIDQCFARFHPPTRTAKGAVEAGEGEPSTKTLGGEPSPS